MEKTNEQLLVAMRATDRVIGSFYAACDKLLAHKDGSNSSDLHMLRGEVQELLDRVKDD